MDAIEKWGVSVEEAVDLALKEIKLSREDVEVTVLEEPSRGFFGIGSKLAKVRVERKAPVVEDKKEEDNKTAKPAFAKAGPIGKEEVNPEDLVTKEDRQGHHDRKPKESRDRKDRKRKPKKEKRESINIALDGMDKESMTIV